MKNTIFYVGGSKGGIGKSLISTVLVQFLLDKYGDTKKIHLIETDESNPDVGRMYQGKIPVSAFILDEREAGWITFFDILEKSENTLFVVNSAARSNYGIEANGGNFSAALEERSDKYDLVTFWPINRQVDCVNLLMDYLKIVQFGPVFTIRNEYWGKPEDFEIYKSVIEKPKNRELVQSRIRGVLNFPSLNDLITVQLYTYGKTLPEIPDKLNVFKRQIFKSWQSNAYAMFEATKLFEDDAQKTDKESAGQ